MFILPHTLVLCCLSCCFRWSSLKFAGYLICQGKKRQNQLQLPTLRLRFQRRAPIDDKLQIIACSQMKILFLKAFCIFAFVIIIFFILNIFKRNELPVPTSTWPSKNATVYKNILIYFTYCYLHELLLSKMQIIVFSKCCALNINMTK